MGDDSDRDAILSRRQRLIAIALSGLTTAACSGEPELEVPIEGNQVEAPAEVEVQPYPCLTPIQPFPPNGEEPPVAEVPPEVQPAEPPPPPEEARPRPRPRPHPCLSVEAERPEPRPQVCLSRLPADPDEF
jgi:hypothetical protein